MGRGGALCLRKKIKIGTGTCPVRGVTSLSEVFSSVIKSGDARIAVGSGSGSPTGVTKRRTSASTTLQLRLKNFARNRTGQSQESLIWRVSHHLSSHTEAGRESTDLRIKTTSLYDRATPVMKRNSSRASSYVL